MKSLYKNKIAVIGLGYVGLPLVLKFASKFSIIGFDINKKRVMSLQKGIDDRNEFKKNQILKNNICFSYDKKKLSEIDIFIVAVPTPLKRKKIPDMRPLIGASKMIGNLLRRNSVVIYESTVYPGATEEVCIPILEKQSNLKFNKDFFCGYSPERISPGDKGKEVDKVIKIVSGSNRMISKFIKRLYGKLNNNKIYEAKSIKVAEAAKVIENIQRDTNIALINELAMICSKLNINTQDVLSAAETKWNFHKYSPGLVGGHCISVDPYYMIKKSNQLKLTPKLIATSREINEFMPKFLVKEIVKKANVKNIKKEKLNVLILGLTYKKNVKDIRNSKIFDIINEFKMRNFLVTVLDPLIQLQDIENKINFKLKNNFKINDKFDIALFAVPHDYFRKNIEKKILKLLRNKFIFCDITGQIKSNLVDLRL